MEMIPIVNENKVIGYGKIIYNSDGDPIIEMGKPTTCSKCKGKGSIVCPQCDGHGEFNP